MSTSGKRPANNLDQECAKKQRTDEPNKIEIAICFDETGELININQDKFPEFLDTIPVEQKVDMQIILSQVDNQSKTVQEIYNMYLKCNGDIVNTIMEYV